ncbi:MAG: ClpXP protease specificity-enhancing factor [Ectothiorhodospiraceae bacterium]|nr:ClpXP protease specificity-enhancing factor [Ectothiorhodospiraceae bacterium]
MTSSRPYLVRALYDWIVDNDLTPYLLVDAGKEGLEAPMEYADNGRLVLNISPRAVRNLDLGQTDILFSGRFGGHALDVRVPIHAVLAIYARENGQGMLFSDTDDQPPSPPEGDNGKGVDGPSRSGRPNLRVVK